MKYKNDLILKAAKGEYCERTPVWVMRQAGRILPEYREVRSSVKDFIELAKTPELAAEVTLQPVRILEVDAAIIFSDILVIPEAMGVPYVMEEKKGPLFPKTIRNEEDAKILTVEGVDEHLQYVTDAIKIVKEQLKGEVPLIGFAGAPWTIFSYIVEGAGSKTFSQARKMLYNNPSLSHHILNKITQATISYLKAQIKAGADLVQIFDSWAGILPPDQYNEFSLKYISQICDAITEVPVTVFAKGAFFARKEMSQIKCNTIGLDWNMEIEESRKIIGENKTLQGNLDPCALYGTKSDIERATEQMLKAFGPTRHIANLGHGVYPDTPFENVKVFIDTVKKFRY